ncbi:uncharacterized protein LOC123534287 [Mercenaria mercenaria]|uniref:uncharacterized protein LOC123534287 n=1 Tax=Mercenaria mercenaria TaxID=6596 RepID=UPI00234E5788|nr:uncharacterized protein LOC123534287 [Mercenaria mercenaria]
MKSLMKWIPSTRVLGLCRKTNNVCFSWLLYLAITAFLGFLIQMQLKFAMKLIADGNKHVFHFDQNQDDSTRNVIISGYAKGGGNVVGEVLGSRPETFYAYEPLITMAESYYFKNSSTMCTTFLDTCFKSTLTDTALDTLRNVLACSNINIGEEYHQKWDTGGEVWLKYHECLLDKEYSKEFCDKYLSHQCKRATVKVIKSERMSTELLGTLLREHSNVSVVHMFRDPRGILFVNRKSPALSSLSSASGLKKYASSLCSRMRDDLKAGLELATLYPKRFKLMLFEDFRLDMVTVLRPLFRFLGLPLATNDKNLVEIVELKKALAKYNREAGHNAAVDIEQLRLDTEDSKLTKVHPFSWRKEIDMKMLKIIDEFCGDLYVKLGYNTYENVKKLRDLTNWPSYGGGGIYPL